VTAHVAAGNAGRALRVVMVAYGDIRYDSRVQREATSLAMRGHEVTLACLAAGEADRALADRGVRVVQVPAGAGAIIPGTPSPFRVPGASFVSRAVGRLRWLSGYVLALRRWGRTLVRTQTADVWHVHDFAGLVAVAGRVPRGTPLVYDVHDLFLETGTGALLPGPLRSAIRALERRLVRRVDLVVAVNDALAEVFQARNAPRRMIVVHNCPPLQAEDVAPTDRLREAAGIAMTAPVILYHGLLALNRGLDTLLAAILDVRLERAHLVLLGYGRLLEPLRQEATREAYGGRVHVLDAVPPDELLAWVGSADVGAMAMPHDSENLFLSTPNKLFECLAAGTPVVVSDFPAVRRIVVDDPLGRLGRTCDPSDPRDVARALAEILDLPPGERLQLRRACRRAAVERWNWDEEVKPLVQAYARFAEGPSAGS
jgi:glycosyltransferase involved in cell wall biosynthesis